MPRPALQTYSYTGSHLASPRADPQCPRSQHAQLTASPGQALATRPRPPAEKSHRLTSASPHRNQCHQSHLWGTDMHRSLRFVFKLFTCFTFLSWCLFNLWNIGEYFRSLIYCRLIICTSWECNITFIFFWCSAKSSYYVPKSVFRFFYVYSITHLPGNIFRPILFRSVFL